MLAYQTSHEILYLEVEAKGSKSFAAPTTNNDNVSICLVLCVLSIGNLCIVFTWIITSLKFTI